MCVCVSIADLLAGLHGSVCAGELTREQACFDLLVRKFAKKKKYVKPSSALVEWFFSLVVNLKVPSS